MRNRAAVLAGMLALTLGAVLPVPAGAASITTTGTVVSKGKDTLVVRIDDHHHRIPFAIDGSTVLPADLKAGRRVRVVYHPTGTTGQTADEVVLLDGGTSKSR